MIGRTALLQQLPGFGELLPEDWLGLDREVGYQELGRLERRPCRPGELAFVVDGCACLRWTLADGRELAFDYRRTGSLHGAIAGSHHLTTGAHPRALLLLLPEQVFGALALRYPALAADVGRALELSLAKTQRRLHQVAFLDVRGRVLGALQDLAAEHGEALPEGTRLALKLTHRDVAGMVGATRESASLALNQLEREGLLAFDEKRPVLLARHPDKRKQAC